MVICMKLLVTGCAGFIGFNYIKYTLKNINHKIFGIDKMTYAANPEIKDIHDDNFKFLQLDINNSKIKNIIDDFNPDYIINFAAETHVDNSFQKPNEFLINNVQGVLNLLNFINPKIKFIQISTDEVYGESEHPKAETDRLLPSNPYAVSKSSADLYVQSYRKTHNIKAYILRLTNNFGPYQNKEKLIPKYIKALVENEKFPLYNKGEHYRTWLHTKETCYYINQLIEKNLEPGIYNLTSENTIKNIDLLKLIHETLSKKINLNYDFFEYFDYKNERIYHDFRYKMNDDKLRSIIKYNRRNFAEELEETVDFYLKKWESK
ncbi:NAD-dependent epimerase/dehydratase family protein [Geotoga petraea]|uniref:NAD-dependent epimerase/dehydratase family protein n=2 Tax=Geotoga petraea TaxID=28234 RepID=A0A4Z0W666_9BACT|nr:NAD-dependent epimerase/dehydratase family protein [Geotoga petraea]